MVLDVGHCRHRHLFAYVERAAWTPLGYKLYGWTKQHEVPSETEEEDDDDAATGLKEEADTVPTAFLGGQQRWTPGAVAEPMPKKLRGSVATDPATRLNRGPAAREQAFTYPVEDAATGPGDEDW